MEKSIENMHTDVRGVRGLGRGMASSARLVFQCKIQSI